MKKNGILNPQLNRVISEMGHRDMLIIADAGLPIPKGVERIDLALKCGTPSFAEVLPAVLSELKVEETYVAKEIKEKNPQILNLISSLTREIKFITHEELKELSKQARVIVRTGECSPYANIILISGVQALKEVSIQIKRADVHAIVGENGAGKSTLMKIAVGELLRDSGIIKVFGQEAQINSPSDGYRYGISLIHQEFSLVPTLDVAQNIFLGRELTSGHLSLMDSKLMYKQTEEILDSLKIFHLDFHLKIGDLTVAQKQVVEIAKALSLNSKIIIMDEPTAALTLEETSRLFEVVRGLKAKGVTTLFISHRLEEIFEIADKVSILRDGELILTKPVAQIDRNQVINNMVGRSLNFVFPPKVKHKKEAKVVLEVKKINKERQFSDVSFQLKEGEILGLAGLVGSGLSEVALAIFGLNRLDTGEIYIKGEKIDINSPFKAIEHGLALLPEDRRKLGLVIVRSVLENLTLPALYRDIARKYFIDLKRELLLAKEAQKELSISFASFSQKVESLSGGNQQKVVVGKWLLTRPKILIMNEPTRGIDVGAKLEIYNIINTLAQRGIGIIFISSEFTEILGIAHRVLVMSEGRITIELDPESSTEEDILKFATRKKVS